MTQDPRSHSGRAPAGGGGGGGSSGSRGRVLIVDDEPAIRRALQLALTRDGFEVVTAPSGADAQTILHATPVDVMLVDLRIPDMRGDVIYHLAAALQPHLASTTIFLTGDVTERADSLIAACHCPFIRKPFELGEVIRVVSAMAPKSRSASA